MPKDYRKIFQEVLKSIKPSKKEKKKLEELAKKALAVTKKEAAKFQAKAILAGSITRDTWLPAKMEFDVFILFPSSLPEKRLEEFGLKVGKEVITKLGGKFIVDYAQHPYVSGTVQGVGIDMVPCYDVKSPEKMKSAVDRTPFHVMYIEKNLPRALSDEVRLLKQFCAAHNIYGADAKTEGFSGYVCELLVIEYGKFMDVLKNVADWEPGEIIDLKGFYSEKDYPKVRKMFWEQPLIIVDPTDKNRNTAAAVSSTSFYVFKKMAISFIESPSGNLFFSKEFKTITEHELIVNQMKRRTELILVRFAPPDVVPDVLWPQLRKFADRLESILEEVKYEFKVLRKDVYTDEDKTAVVLLEMEVSKLPAVQKRIGPKVFDADDSKRFLEKYKNPLLGPFVEDNHWCAEVKRKFMSAREKLFDSLNKNADVLKAKGVPNHVADQIKKKFEIISESDRIMGLVKKDQNFGVFLKRYFEKESLVKS